MSDPAYRAALDAAVKEYEHAMADRRALDVRIAQLHQTIGTLTRLCGLTPTVPLGLTEACRLILRGAPEPLTAVQVRQRLETMGLDLDRYANALAAIHTTLKRLEESGEAALVDLDDTSRQAYALIQSGIIGSRVPPPLSAKRPRSTAPKGKSR